MGQLQSWFLTPITIHGESIIYINDDHFICFQNGITKLYFYDDSIKHQCYDSLYNVKLNNDTMTIYVDDYIIKMIS